MFTPLYVHNTHRCGWGEEKEWIPGNFWDTEESDSMEQAQQRPVGINSSAESNIGDRARAYIL